MRPYFNNMSALEDIPAHLHRDLYTIDARDVRHLPLVLQGAWAFWRDRAGDAPAPQMASFDLGDAPDLEPHVVVTRVMPDAQDFEFAKIGRHIRDRSGRCAEGVRVSKAHGVQGASRIFDAYAAAAQDDTPILLHSDYDGPEWR